MDTKILDEKSGGRLLYAGVLRADFVLLVAILALVAAVSEHVALEAVGWELAGLASVAIEEVLLGLITGLIGVASKLGITPDALD